MGFYVNPTDRSKEAFLIGHGVEVLGRTMRWEDVPKGCLPVVLIQNAFFSAACIAYSERELASCTDPSDTRPRTIFVVEIEDLLPVGGDDFRRWYAKNHNLA